MKLLPEFKLSKEKADLARRPLTLPEKAPAEASQDPKPQEETMEVGGSDAEPNMVPQEGDGTVSPKTGGAAMPPPPDPPKKKKKKNKDKDKELRKCKEQEVERYLQSASSSPERPGFTSEDFPTPGRMTLGTHLHQKG